MWWLVLAGCGLFADRAVVPGGERVGSAPAAAPVTAPFAPWSPPGDPSSSDGDDTDTDVTPPTTGDTTCDGVDDDGDGLLDEDATDGLDWYPDLDRDGWGAGTPTRACRRPPGTSLASTDCDDGDPDVHAGAVELCDGKDDDCDGLVDGDDPDEQGDATWYADADGDGWGGEAVGTGCSAPVSGAVLRPGDCDDANPAAWTDGCATTTLATVPFRAGVGFGDVDGDGLADVVAFDSGEVGDGYLQWIAAYPKPSGELGWQDAAWRLDGSAASESMRGGVLDDATGDGADDLYVNATGPRPTTSAELRIYSIASGSTTPWTTVHLDDPSADAVAWVAGGADVYGDGAVELIASNSSGGTLVLPASAGDLTRDDASTVVSDEGLWLTGVGDLDGDGRPDLVASSLYVPITLLDTLPTGEITADDLAGPVVDVDHGALSTPDVDGDGQADLVVGGWVKLGPVVADVKQADADVAVVGGEYGGAADFDGDGVTDLFTFGKRDGYVYVVQGPLSGTYDVTTLTPAFGLEDVTSAMVAGDVDGDGADDLAVWTGYGPSWMIVSGADE